MQWIVSLSFFLVVSGAVPMASAEETIVIGADIGLTGNVAQYGEWATRGIAIAVEEINNTGGIAARKLEVRFEDSAGNPSKAVTAYHKLRDVDAIQFLLTYQSSIALAVAPLSNRDKVVQMDFSATSPLYSSSNDFTFRTGIVASQLAEDAARELSEKQKVGTVGCMYIENEFGEGMYRVFREKFPGQIVAAESFRAEEADYRPQLLKLKASKVKNIWLVGHLRESGLIVRQAEELGMDVKFFSDSYSVQGADFLKVAGTASEGVTFIAPRFDPDGKNSTLKSFVARYRATHQEDPTYFSAQAYDAVRAFSEALAQCEKSDALCVKDRLYQIDFEGASGRIKFDINGDVVKETAVMQVRDGKFIGIDEQTG